MRTVDLSVSKLELFKKHFTAMWQETGDALSRCISGTATIRKSSSQSTGVGFNAAGRMLKDVQRSLSRTVKNNFGDRNRQRAIDIVLGEMHGIKQDNYQVADPNLRAEFDAMLQSRSSEFCQMKDINLFLTTWNVNGGKHTEFDAGFSAAPWFEYDECQQADIIGIGFQEIVDLNAQNLVNSENKAKKQWGRHLSRLFSTFPNSPVLVTSVQLVGMCLFIFVRQDLLPHLTLVQTDTVKTGAGGKVGNKGGVAVRCRLYNTSICFVCSHLPSGKSHNSDRHAAVADISRRLKFRPPISTCLEHDFVFWFGDLNYRVETENLAARSMIKDGHINAILKTDQLSNAMRNGDVFDGFLEGHIEFPPTYKFDALTDEYDTSEKARTPSWTDRVLFKGPSCKVLKYNSIKNMPYSDHWPVLAHLLIQVESVNEKIKHEIGEAILAELRLRLATVCVYIQYQSTSMDSCDPMNLDELRELFSQCGQVAIIDAISESAVLVTFDRTESARKAENLSGTHLADNSQVLVAHVAQDEEWYSVLDRMMSESSEPSPSKAPPPRPPRPSSLKSTSTTPSDEGPETDFMPDDDDDGDSDGDDENLPDLQELTGTSFDDGDVINYDHRDDLDNSVFEEGGDEVNDEEIQKKSRPPKPTRPAPPPRPKATSNQVPQPRPKPRSPEIQKSTQPRPPVVPPKPKSRPTSLSNHCLENENETGYSTVIENISPPRPPRPVPRSVSESSNSTHTPTRPAPPPRRSKTQNK